MGEFINVHGLINNDPILGVNDISQIANESFRKDGEIVELMVKGEADRKTDHKWRKHACNIIQNSDIVCIYGMSLGDTDLFWWKQLAEWFEKDKNHELVIYCYPDPKKNIRKQEDELKVKISKHLTGNRLESDILVDSVEKRMTVKFAHMSAHSMIKTESFVKATVCVNSNINS